MSSDSHRRGDNHNPNPSALAANRDTHQEDRERIDDMAFLLEKFSTRGPQGGSDVYGARLSEGQLGGMTCSTNDQIDKQNARDDPQ